MNAIKVDGVYGFGGMFLVRVVRLSKSSLGARATIVTRDAHGNPMRLTVAQSSLSHI